MHINTRSRQLALLAIVFITNINAACLVYDAGLAVKTSILAVLNDRLSGRISETERRVYRQFRRIAVLGVNLSLWVINDGMEWRTRRVDPALPETITMMDAYNGVASAQDGYNATSVPVQDATALLAMLDITAPDTAAYVRSQLALYEIVRGSNEGSIDQTGAHRNNRKSGRNILIMSSTDLRESKGGMNAVLDLMNVIGMYRARQGETSTQLDRALLEQETAQTLLDRNADARDVNVELAWFQARVTPSTADGTTDAIRNRRVF